MIDRKRWHFPINKRRNTDTLLGKCLFIHNAIPEYRIAFMKELSKEVDVDFLINDINAAKTIYGFDAKGKDIGINIIYAKGYGTLKRVKAAFVAGKYNCVVFPPADSLKQLIWGLSVAILSKKNHVKSIYWTEKWEPDKSCQPLKKRAKNLVQGFCIKILAMKADVCVASGTRSKEYYKQIGLPEDKIRIVYDSSTSPINNSNNSIISDNNNKKQKIILYLGRVIERKGCIFLIQAYEQIRKNNENVRLIIAGTGDDYYEKCINYVNTKKIKDVLFLGQIDPIYRRELYEAASVFVLPSICKNGVIEAWGLTINEALEAGTPVIATDIVGSSYDLIKNGYNGYVVKQQDIDSLKTAIESIINCSNTGIIQKNCIFTYNKYSVANMSKAFAKVIEGTKIKE